MRSLVLKLHKYISLALAVFWFLQTLSGITILFGREIYAANFGPPSATLDSVALDKRIKAVDATYPERYPGYIFATGPTATQFDVYYYRRDGEGGSRAIRIDGDGTVVSDRDMRQDFFNIVTEFHETLLIDDVGYILQGVSGVFLFTNLILGLQILWPYRKKWGSFFKLSATAPLKAKLYNWHRMVGLVLVIPALLLVGTGVLNVWLDDIKDVFGNPWPVPESVATSYEGEANISLVDALNTSFAAYPGAKLSIVKLPTDSAPYYMVRLLQDGEIRYVYGNTTLYISAVTGGILANYDQMKAPLKANIFGSFYSIHNGEAAGLAGRLLVLITGLMMIGMICLGIALWWVRRAR